MTSKKCTTTGICLKKRTKNKNFVKEQVVSMVMANYGFKKVWNIRIGDYIQVNIICMYKDI